jgi:hypothetical protein
MVTHTYATVLDTEFRHPGTEFPSPWNGISVCKKRDFFYLNYGTGIPPGNKFSYFFNA